ncbi:MAG: cupin domain-containing protein [Mariniphaga sp.]
MAILNYTKENWVEVSSGVYRKIVYLEHLMTVMIEFRNGPWNHAEPYHSHIHEQTCYVAKGEIILFCEEETEQHLCEGDLFYIPSGKKHTIRVLTPVARLIDSFSPVREDFIL